MFFPSAHPRVSPARSSIGPYSPRNDLIRVGSRRWLLQTGVAGVAGLSLPALLAARDNAAARGQKTNDRRAVVQFWLSGGPSQIDMWIRSLMRRWKSAAPSGRSLPKSLAFTS